MSSNKIARKAPKRKAANSYTLADPISAGEVLTDIFKKQWKIGKSIGTGGFGEIYSAKSYKQNDNNAADDYVIKIEPHANGPLFVEMHFYMRNAKENDIKAWIKEKGLKHLGMPKYIGSGSHEYKKKKYRFLVMERFGKDLWTIFLESGRCFPTATVFKLGLQIIDVLEYIHSRGYVHADIKGANILLDVNKKLQYQIYLVDFGLAAHVSSDCKPDPKKAHNGTIEYTSRDAHIGVLTKRGDIEILAYNMLQWLGHTLPWENNLKDPSSVQKEKEKFMNNIKSLQAFENVPEELTEIFKYVMSMEYNTEPDYEKLRTILSKGVRNNDGLNTGGLIFKTPPLQKELANKTSRLNKVRGVNGQSTKADDSSDNKKLKKTRIVKKEKIEFNLEDLEDSDDNYEPPTNVVKPDDDAEPKKTRNSARKVRNKTVSRRTTLNDTISTISNRRKSIKLKPTTTKLTKLRQSPRTKPKNSTVRTNKRLSLSNTKENQSDSDIFLSFDENTPNRSSKYHPRNIKNSQTSTSDLEEKNVKKTRRKVVTKKKVLKSSATTNESSKSPKSWRNFPTVRNGRVAVRKDS